MEGGAVGEVVESQRRGLRAGRPASCTWAAGATKPCSTRAPSTSCPISAPSRRPSSAISGVTGATAYFGLLDAASAKEGDIVFVSAAAGAVGSAVVQIAKAKGMTVIGSAGGADKCDFVRSLGADAGRRLQGAGRSSRGSPRRRPRASTSISTMSAATISMRRFALARMRRALRHLRDDRGLQQGRAGRLPLHHAGHRHAHPDAGLHRLRLSSRGWANSTATWAAGWRAGSSSRSETVVDGLEKMPDAFLGLFSGDNIGKMLVRL